MAEHAHTPPIPTPPITLALRRRIKNDVDLLIALLDALDAPMEDLEPEPAECGGDPEPTDDDMPLRIGGVVIGDLGLHPIFVARPA